MLFAFASNQDGEVLIVAGGEMLCLSLSGSPYPLAASAQTYPLAGLTQTYPLAAQPTGG